MSTNTAPGWARPELLAETDWLAAHLDDPDLIVVDCDLLPAYQRLHIPGAVWSRSRYWKAPDAPGGMEGGIHAIADADAFARIMGSLGIRNDSRVVAYDGSGGLYAARFWWTCGRFGFDAVQVLHGGLDKWYAEGRPLSNVNERPALRRRSSRPARTTRRSAAWPTCSATAPRTSTCSGTCARTGSGRGANARGTQHGGRVPNASHLEWLETLEHPVRTLKSPPALRALLAERGITPEKTVTTY